MTYIKNLVNSGASKESLVHNPLYGEKKHLFLSSRDYPKEPLEDVIKTSIQKKENKRHSDKENTVLLIDNRTLIYEIPDLEAALISLENVLATSTFKEIWFYTGYYSELDGSNAEYSFAPLKISESQTVKWNKFMDNINRADV